MSNVPIVFFYGDGSLKVPPCQKKKKKQQLLGPSFAVVIWSIRVMEEDAAPCGLLQRVLQKHLQPPPCCF